jgi:hypothetical protein
LNKHGLVINSQRSSSWFLKEPQKVETTICNNSHLFLFQWKLKTKYFGMKWINMKKNLYMTKNINKSQWNYSIKLKDCKSIIYIGNFTQFFCNLLLKVHIFSPIYNFCVLVILEYVWISQNVKILSKFSFYFEKLSNFQIIPKYATNCNFYFLVS